jgi:hypothetical protein
MPILRILSKDEIAVFDSPPKFNRRDQEKYFALDVEIENYLDRIQTPSSKVCFIILYGYFKMTNKFFSPKKFWQNDIEYVASFLGADKNITKADFLKYVTGSFSNHKKLIRQNTGTSNFSDSINQELDSFVAKQIRPKQVFTYIIRELQEKRVEIPSYNNLANLITKSFNKNEERLLETIKSVIDEDTITFLDDLMSPAPQRNSDIYKVTLLKKISHSSKPHRIKESIEDFIVLKKAYDQVATVVATLDLSQESVHYHAVWAMKARVSQLSQFSNPYKRYLHLIAFINYQYCIRQDSFVDILIKAVQSTKSGAKRLQRDQYFGNMQHRSGAIKAINSSHKSLKKVVGELKLILESSAFTNEEKITKALNLVSLQTTKPQQQELLDYIAPIQV